ncbi:TIGR03621 family F420-dependent LLM class oxidoreductase [Amycolatopsis sp. NPDC051128]|uniref:TIGR03621 family F420-dependent LLM class oxidoreductase n=1 Tax=Amycolatopsis sp. NPDC051128 TaxID=3155412 RepID=UPI0034179CC8
MRPFRFGVDLVVPRSRAEWVEKCRKAEDLGYDVVGAADHLGMAPPFPALVLAAEATERVRLNTFVINACFHNPVLLARDVTGTDQFTGGRLELGLGAGYVEAEFRAAGIEWGTPGQRFARLEHAVTELKRRYADPEHKPEPVRKPGPPLLLGGRGDRVLKLAAEHADIVGFTGTAGAKTEGRMALANAAELTGRVEFARKALGDRDAELNLLVHVTRITGDRRAALDFVHRRVPDLGVDELAELPTVLVGSAEAVADQLLRTRETLGISYFTVIEDDLTRLAPVIERLHGR